MEIKNNRVEKNKKNLLQCRCKTCPSYSLGCLIKAGPKIAKTFLSSQKSLEKETHLESLFCAFEKSDCIGNKKGCRCPDCAVYKKYGLNKAYYCQDSE